MQHKPRRGSLGRSRAGDYPLALIGITFTVLLAAGVVALAFIDVPAPQKPVSQELDAQALISQAQ